MMFRHGYKIRFLFIGALLFIYFPLNIYAATSLNDYPQIKKSWDEGALTEAIVQLENVAKNTANNSEIVELIKKITFQKKKLDQWIEKATLLQEQQKFKEAKEILDFAKVINPNYLPYKKLVDEIKTTQDALNYPSTVIFDGSSLGNDWKPYERDGKLSTYAQFDNSTLLIDVPKGHVLARVGIESNDTIINLTETKQPLSHHLTFNLDPKNTTGFVIDVEGENIDKKSRSSNGLSIVYKSIDDKSAVLELHKDRSLHTKLEMDVAPESMELVIQPNNFMYLHLPDGRYLQTTSAKYPMPTKGYSLKVYSKANQYQSAAKLALKSIELRNIPFKKKKEKTVIFDGKYLGDVWKAYAWHQNHFSEYAKFHNNALMVNVPEKSGWGQVGIQSNDTIIDLTETNQSLAHHLTFKFDSKNTTGFAIDLEGKNIDKKSRSANALSIVYKSIDDKSAVLELHKDRGVQTKLKMDAVPESMELVIQPNNFMYLHLPDGRYLQTTSVKYPMPTKGYKLKVYSKPKQRQLASKMSLKSIELKKLPYEKKKVKTVIFDGKYLEGVWKPYAAHHNHFLEFSRFENNALLVDVPEKSGWGEVGIQSSDTIINFTETNQSLEYHLKFNFDPKNTTGFAIEIGSLIRLDYVKREENGKSFIELRKSGAYLGPRISYGKLELGRDPFDFLEIIMSADNIIKIKLADGRSIQMVSTYLSIRNHKVKVYSQSEKKDQPVKMALKSIKLQKKSLELLDVSNLEKSESHIVLFDANLDELWIPYNEQYTSYFSEYGKFSDHKLIIDVPKDHKWGEAGICSPTPLVWLDSLGKDGEIKTTFSFDSLETTGFSIAAGGFNHSWNEPYDEYINLSWAKVEDKDISKLRFKIRNNLLLDENLTGKAPSTIILSFKNGEIGMEGDTFAKKTFEWPHLVENRAFHLFVFSHAYKKKLPVKMALKKIVLDRKSGEPIPPAKPAKGVAILPVKEIYGSNTIDKWECQQTKKKAKEHNCTLETSGLFINVKKDEKNTFGMKSKEKIVHLDRRKIKDTPLKMVIHFNPKKTDHFYIYFGYHHLSLEKKNKDTYEFKWGDKWVRNIDAKWLENEWNGKVNITMANKWTEIGLDGNVAINRPDKVGDRRHLTLSVAPLNTKMKNDASLELEKITTQWLVPDGMTAIERWNFMDDEDFDPETFLREIREEL